MIPKQEGETERGTTKTKYNILAQRGSMRKEQSGRAGEKRTHQKRGGEIKGTKKTKKLRVMDRKQVHY